MGNKEICRETSRNSRCKTIREFAEVIRGELLSKDNRFEIKITEHLKNNGTTCLGLDFFTRGSAVSPVIYIEKMWIQYQEGADVSSLSEHIMQIYEENLDRKFKIDVEGFLDFEAVRHKVVYKLVNAQKNKDLLQNVPHRRFHDLAVLYLIMVENDRDGIATATIKNEMMETWKIKEEALYQCAGENTPKIFPAKAKSLSDFIMETLEIAKTEDMENMDIPVQILTNEKGINGAAVVLYPGYLEMLLEKFEGKDFYILPSSIHEVLAFPENDIGAGREECLDMVKTINQTEVSEDEVLSDNIYLYHADTGELELIEQTEEA